MLLKTRSRLYEFAVYDPNNAPKLLGGALWDCLGGQTQFHYTAQQEYDIKTIFWDVNLKF